MMGMDHWLLSWHQPWLPSGPIGPAVTSAQASDQFKGYPADTCPLSTEVCLSLMAIQQINRLTGRVATPAGDARLHLAW